MRIDDFYPLLPAESRLCRHVYSRRADPFCLERGTPGIERHRRTIRCSLIRALVLKQLEGYHVGARGLTVDGAVLVDTEPAGIGLDLAGATLSCDLSLRRCHIEVPLHFQACSVRGLDMQGSRLDCGFSGDLMTASGSIVLDSAIVYGCVSLIAAQIGGSLDCDYARFYPPLRSDMRSSDLPVLNGDRISVDGSILLRGLRSSLPLRFVSASLKGNMGCQGLRIRVCAGRIALDLEGAKLDRHLFLNDGARIGGTLDLTGARIGFLHDESASWPKDLRLDRCRYGGLARADRRDMAASRLEWLSRFRPSPDGPQFWPQPYEECARVLRDSGHSSEARAVLIEKERLQRRARHRRMGQELSQAKGTYHKLDLWLRRWLLRGGDVLVGVLVAYGRRPLQAAIPLIAMLFIGAMIFSLAAGFGQIKPNLPVIQRSAEWVDCAGDARGQVACFQAKPQGKSYPQFAPLIYSADTLLPIVSLEMQSYWIPDDSKPIGAVARFYLWVHIFAGWGLTLLAVAGFSGLIKTDNTR